MCVSLLSYNQVLEPRVPKAETVTLTPGKKKQPPTAQRPQTFCCRRLVSLIDCFQNCHLEGMSTPPCEDNNAHPGAL
jgi:hypothetical protein